MLVIRREDNALVKGNCEFIDDIEAPDCLHAYFYRSQVAYGLIKQIQLKQALLLPGIIAIFDGSHFSSFCMPKFNDLLNSKKEIKFPLMTNMHCCRWAKSKN